MAFSFLSFSILNQVHWIDKYELAFYCRLTQSRARCEGVRRYSAALPFTHLRGFPMSTLTSTTVRAVLDRLYAEAEKTDQQVFARVNAERPDFSNEASMGKLIGMLEDAFMPVSPEVGRLLYMLLRSRRPKTVVEFGTSLGLSAIHIAAALRDNGAGQLITTELSATKAARARDHLTQCGLADAVDLRVGDARETLKGVGEIDFLLLDGWKGLYLPMLQQLEPVLTPGTLVVADDVVAMAEPLRPYLNYVRDSKNGYTTVQVPLDDGIEVSLRR
jgi:predicted O-methyltransferase YrrM